MFDALFSKSGISLERLRSLCLVEKAGGITKAAGGSTAKQSQFSRQIKELEQFFGVELLDRDVQPHRLTAEGRALTDIARELLGKLDDYTLQCSDMPVRLTIGAGESLIQWLLMPLLEDYRKLQPTTSVSFLNRTTNDVVEGLLNGEIDLGVIRESAITKQLNGLPLGAYEFRVFVPKRLRTKFGPVVDIRDLARVRLALLEGGGEFRTAVDQLASNAGVHLNVELECSSSTQVAYAVSSLGYAGILPDFAAKVVGKEKVTVHKVKGFDVQRKLAVAWNPRRADSRPVIGQAAKALKKLLTAR